MMRRPIRPVFSPCYLIQEISIFQATYKILVDSLIRYGRSFFQLFQNYVPLEYSIDIHANVYSKDMYIYKTLRENFFDENKIIYIYNQCML